MIKNPRCQVEFFGGYVYNRVVLYVPGNTYAICVFSILKLTVMKSKILKIL